MYKLTKHVIERFSERNLFFDPISQEEILYLLKTSKPCLLSPYHRRWRRMIHDIKDDVKSYYRFAKGWTFVIVKDKYTKSDVVVTAYFNLRPRPKIL